MHTEETSHRIFLSYKWYVFIRQIAVLLKLSKQPTNEINKVPSNYSISTIKYQNKL